MACEPHRRALPIVRGRVLCIFGRPVHEIVQVIIRIIIIIIINIITTTRTIIIVITATASSDHQLRAQFAAVHGRAVQKLPHP